MQNLNTISTIHEMRLTFEEYLIQMDSNVVKAVEEHLIKMGDAKGNIWIANRLMTIGVNISEPLLKEISLDKTENPETKEDRRRTGLLNTTASELRRYESRVAKSAERFRRSIEG